MSINTKKLASIALTATTVLWAAGVASLPLANAQSTSSLQAQIAALLAQIQQLQGQLGTSSSTTTTSSCYPFSSDLTVGSSGAAVTALQQVLIAKGYLTAVSAPTGYFGALTQKAVGKWQAANGITPTAGYFGAKSRAFYASTCVGTTTTTTTTGTGTTTTAPATGLSVGLAAQPTNTSLISGSGSGSTGAARVPVLAVNFTAGNSGAVTVSSVNFHKTGVLADSSIAGAYLIYNGQVIAQYNSISNGVISFSGLNWQIPAGQTEDIQLAIDVAGNLNAGNTTGFSLNSASDVTAWDTNNNAITPNGSFPMNGNTFTVTQVNNPSLSYVTIASSSIGTTVTAGTQGNIVGAYNVSVFNNPVWLNSIAFHVIGSANMANLQNVKLLINGTQVGATLSTVSNNIAYFNLTSAPAKLNTGSNNLQIQSDVAGSPNMNFQWEILNGYDVLAVDSQYNVPVSVTVSSQDAVVNIQPGQTTTSQDTSTPTGNIAKGVSQVTLAKFDVYASGEPTKVQFLDFDLVFTGNANTTGTIASLVKNVNITDDSGQQVGTTINTPPSSNYSSCADAGTSSGFTTNEATAGMSAGSVVYEDCFGTPGSPINYVIPANTTRVLSLKADIQNTASFGTVTANLLNETQNNLQGQISSHQTTSSGASGSALTLSNSSLTATQNQSLGTQSLSKGSTNQEIGSYALTAASAEGVNINTVTIAVNASTPTLQNLKLIVNGAQFGTTQPTVSSPGTYTFSGSSFNIPAGSTVNVNVYADINSSDNSGTTSGGATSLTGFSGSGAISNSSISLTGGSIAGQNITISGSSAVTVSANQGLNPTIGQLSMGTTGNTLAAFNFQETANIENIKVTQLNVVDVLTSSTLGNATNTAVVLPSFNTLSLWNGATQVGGQANYVGTTTVGNQNAFLYQFQFGNSSNFVIPRNGTLALTLKGNANAFTAGNVTDGSIHTFEVATSSNAGGVTNINTTSTVTALGQTSNQPATIALSSAAGTAQTVLRNGLVFSAAQLGATSNRSKSAGDQLATLTFTPGNGGSLALNTVTVTFSGNAIATSTVSQMAGFASSTYLLLNGTQYPETTYGSSVISTSTGVATVTWNFGAGINGFQVNGSPVTFTLVANDFNNTNTAGSNNAVSMSATINATSSIQYTDGTDSNSTTATGINLPASVITPLQIFSTQFVQNS